MARSVTVAGKRASEGAFQHDWQRIGVQWPPICVLAVCCSTGGAQNSPVVTPVNWGFLPNSACWELDEQFTAC
jgi:hypothetical protein